MGASERMTCSCCVREQVYCISLCPQCVFLCVHMYLYLCSAKCVLVGVSFYMCPCACLSERVSFLCVIPY